jgi:hypothetical protein
MSGLNEAKPSILYSSVNAVSPILLVIINLKCNSVSIINVYHYDSQPHCAHLTRSRYFLLKVVKYVSV